jgi:hypothetical protein
MSALPSLRIKLLEILATNPDPQDPVFQGILREFVRECGTGWTYGSGFDKDDASEPDFDLDMKPTIVDPRDFELFRKHRITPRRWNTPVSAHTGVPLDGSDGRTYSLGCVAMMYEHFLALNYLEFIERRRTPIEGEEDEMKCRAKLQSILTEAAQAQSRA